eukprot:g18364.t1
MQLQLCAPRSICGACRETAVQREAARPVRSARLREGAALSAFTSVSVALVAQRKVFHNAKRHRERRRVSECRSTSEESLDFGLESELIVKVPPYDRRKIGVKKFLADDRVIEIQPPLLKWLVLQALLLTRPKSSAANYKKIWAWPLMWLDLGKRFEVRIGMQYSSPTVGESLKDLAESGVDNVVLVPMFPHYASGTTGSCLAGAYRTAAELYCTPFISVLPPFYGHRLYVAAMKKQILETIGERGKNVEHTLFSFHGVPEEQCSRTDISKNFCNKSPNCCSMCFETARLLAYELGLEDGRWSIGFQSRLTLRGTIEWIKPYTDEAFMELAKKGVKKLAVEEFREAGGEELVVIPCLNSVDHWVKNLAQIIREHIADNARHLECKGRQLHGDTKIHSRVTSAASSPKCSTVTSEEASHALESPTSNCWSEASELEDWTKEKALELQQKLLESFTSPSFQLTLHELGRKYRASKGTDRRARAGFKQLVRKAQFEVIPEYGFPCSEEGAYERYKTDADIFVNSTIIKEVLFGESQYPEIVEEDDYERFAATTSESKPQTKTVILELLQTLLLRFGDPFIQEEVENLKREADHRAGRVLNRGVMEPWVSEDPEGYYHLPGRQELALDVQVDVLPSYGFEGNRKGQRKKTATSRSDAEVQKRFDAINMKLGMSAAAATRFRLLVQEIEGTPLPLIGLGRANAAAHPPPIFCLTKSVS